MTEAQIIRYSRQILLAQVGGRGQEKLLASGAKLVGRGAAQATAAAYLAAGGIAVHGSQPDSRGAKVREDEAGFLFGKGDAQRPFAPALHSAVAELNPDAAENRDLGAIGEMPADFSGPAPWVAMGWRGNRGEVAYRSQSGCAECFMQTVRGLANPPPGPLSVLVGTTGALVFQRLCLGASNELGVLSIEGSGEIRNGDVSRCGRCA
jgi:hypothetical protein